MGEQTVKADASAFITMVNEFARTVKRGFELKIENRFMGGQVIVTTIKLDKEE